MEPSQDLPKDLNFFENCKVSLKIRDFEMLLF